MAISVTERKLFHHNHAANQSKLSLKNLSQIDKNYLNKLSQSCISYLFAKYPDHNINNTDKMQPFFIILQPFVIYLNGFGLTNMSDFS